MVFEKLTRACFFQIELEPILLPIRTIIVFLGLFSFQKRYFAKKKKS